MPGPKATNRRTREAAPNTPSRKVKRKLEARIAAWPGVDARDGSGQPMKCHKPGSQNRHKS